MEAAKFQAEIAVLLANISKLNAETGKLLEETAKRRRERVWVPFIAGAGAFAGLLAAAVAALKLIP